MNKIFLVSLLVCCVALLTLPQVIEASDCRCKKGPCDDSYEEDAGPCTYKRGRKGRFCCVSNPSG
ncbi:hypothetical protein DPMN_156838 [Dreissena polymorpha]|uniref:Uncharacterized protein n=1 Tax=Dreissena polymorpha TaxID=45954 RepID=A0A9D4J7X6_DREPO|nr:hypothetical protein DPMN_156838 [Dreissena polymorpha]